MSEIADALFKFWDGQNGFDELVDAYNGRLAAMTLKFARKFFRGVNQCYDSLYNTALTALWQAVRKYRMVCPRCLERFGNIQLYSIHTIGVHGRDLKPKYDLQLDVYINIHSALHREWVAEWRRDKYPLPGFRLRRREDSRMVELETAKLEDGVSEVDLHDAIEHSMSYFDETEREIIYDVLAKCGIRKSDGKIKSTRDSIKKIKVREKFMKKMDLFRQPLTITR